MEKAAYIRTLFAALKVSSLMACQIKHTSRHKEKQAASKIESNIDSYIRLVELNFNKRNGEKELKKMNKEFDTATDFIGNIIAVSSIVPNDKALQEAIIEDFINVVKNRLK